jgi:menaquinone-dependent protoporphyrinogen oxidase
MRILIGYASPAGSTWGIAERLATRLEGAGHVTVVESVDRVAAIAGYDPVMLSSAIHNGQWLPDAAEAVTRLASALASLPVWAFSASSIGATSSTVSARLARSLHARTPLAKAVQQLAELTDLHGHRVFAGVVRRGLGPRQRRIPADGRSVR